MKKNPESEKGIMGRIYRKILALEKELRLANEELYSVRITLKAIDATQRIIKATQVDHTHRLTAHCERLLREKETLRKLLDANKFMATPLVDAISKQPLVRAPHWESPPAPDIIYYDSLDRELPKYALKGEGD